MSKKTYYENLNEISSDKLFDGLLGYGLFTDRIPPFLSSESFLSFCKNPPLGFNFEKKSKKYVSYEGMRNINIPRLLSIPNPIAYRNQCDTLRKNWDKLLEYFKNKTELNSHKISRIHIRKIENSFRIFEMNYKNFSTDDYPEPELLIGKRFIVKADIANCFPSIYTHSIPWALVTKAYSKTHTSTSEWFNEIDLFTRNTKEAETHGILIGAHASNLISEIVLVSVDEKLYKDYKYIRNIDDYTCYLESFQKAEQFLIDLSSELKRYGLILNHKKTEIIELPLASTEHWIRKINTFVFPDKDKELRLSDVRAFLDISLELMKENKDNSAILNYAIKVLSKRVMTTNAKKYFINTVHHLILIYPYLIHLLENNVFSTFEVTKDDIEKIAKNVFIMCIEKKQYEAVSYALYFSIKYDFKIDDDLFSIVDKNRDTVFMLLSYLHDLKFNNYNRYFKQYKALAKSLIDDIDEYWLFVYEVLPKSILKGYWKKMKEQEVTFIIDDYKE